MPDIFQDTYYVFDVSHCCKDFDGLLEARLMKYVNPSNTICWTTMEQFKTQQSYLMDATWLQGQYTYRTK